MSKLTALGLELDFEEDAELTISPVDAIVIAEGFDSDGDTVYVVLNTPGMTSVKGSGFIQFARQWLDLKMMNEIVQATYAPDEEL